MNLSVEARRRNIEIRHPQWEGLTLYEYFERTAKIFTQREMVITDSDIYYYGDVLELSERLAVGLSKQGLQSGSHIGLIMANYLDVIPLLFAIWRCGCIAVPINTNYRADELSYVLRQSRCNFLVSMDMFRGRDYLKQLDKVMPLWRTGEYEGFPDLKGIAIFGGAKDVPLHFKQLLKDHKVAPPITATRASDTALIMYTSGTTGNPKGVLITHDNLLRGAYTVAYHHGFEDGRRAIFSLPLYHCYGIVQGLLAGMITGGSIVPLLEFSAPAMLSAIARHRVNYLMVVPTMMLALLEEAKRDHYDFSTLTAIHNAAAPTPAHVWRDIQQTFGCNAVFTSYGQTETTVLICATKPGDKIETVTKTQGVVAFAGVAAPDGFDGRIAQLKLIDPVTGVDCAAGESGEICTRGPLNTIGYFEQPHETGNLFTHDGWLKTGDLASFDDKGALILTGRKKDLYKSGGELVSPKEIEDILTTHSEISQAHVLGVPDEKWGEVGFAWLVAENGCEPTTDKLRDFLKNRLAPFKQPRMMAFIAADKLPKTSTGKVQKQRLIERSCEIYRTSRVAE